LAIAECDGFSRCFNITPPVANQTHRRSRQSPIGNQQVSKGDYNMKANPRFPRRARWISACLRITLFAFLLVVARGANNQSVTSASISGANLLALAMNGKIAFVSNRDGNREIFVMNADGTNQTQLTNNTEPDEASV
jgi:hypothetical protein